MNTGSKNVYNWEGVVPSNWERIPARYCVASRKNGDWGEESSDVNEGRYCLRAADFDYAHLSFKNCTSFVKRSYSSSSFKKIALKDGDLLVEKSGGGDKVPVGRAVLYTGGFEACFSNFLERIRVKPAISPRFFFYWWTAGYQSGAFSIYFNQTTGIQNLNTTELLTKCTVALPPYTEQCAIAKQIDSELQTIDATTNTLETQISTLERYRASVIHEAVTRGLDPTAPTKPSGVEWFDAIPSNWTATRITAVAERHSGHTPNRTTPEYWDNGDIVWISLADSPSLRKQKFVYASKTLTTQAGINHSSAELLPAGSVLLSRDASVGLCAIAGCDLAVSQHFMAYVCGPKLNNSYLLYCLKDMQQVFHKLSMGSTIPTIGLPLIKRLAIPLPPREEQDAIVARLDARTAAIDAVIATKRKQLDVLKRRRQSLIYEYVTGKRRVGEEG